MQKRVLVVEDDLSLQPVLTKMIRRINPSLNIECVTSAEGALNRLLSNLKASNDEGYDLIVSDVFLSGHRSGLDLLNACKVAKLKTSVILTSSKDVHLSTSPFLRKPISFRDFEKHVAPILVENKPAIPYAKKRFLEYLYLAYLDWLVLHLS
jgi:response regulator of citrate/malate metabolism